MRIAGSMAAGEPQDRQRKTGGADEGGNRECGQHECDLKVRRDIRKSTSDFRNVLSQLVHAYFEPSKASQFGMDCLECGPNLPDSSFPHRHTGLQPRILPKFPAAVDL